MKLRVRVQGPLMHKSRKSFQEQHSVCVFVGPCASHGGINRHSPP